MTAYGYTDAIRWVGLAISLMALIATVPEGVRQINADGVRRWRIVRKAIGRIIPALAVTPVAVDMDARWNVASATAIATVHAAGLTWPAELGERVDALRRETEALRNDVLHLRGDLDRERQERARADGMLRQELHGHMSTVNQRFEKEKQSTVKIDRDGIPVIVLGLLITGLNGEIASLPRWVGVVGLMITFCFAYCRAHVAYHGPEQTPE